MCALYRLEWPHYDLNPFTRPAVPRGVIFVYFCPCLWQWHTCRILSRPGAVLIIKTLPGRGRVTTWNQAGPDTTEAFRHRTEIFHYLGRDPAKTKLFFETNGKFYKLTLKSSVSSKRCMKKSADTFPVLGYLIKSNQTDCGYVESWQLYGKRFMEQEVLKGIVQ